MSPTFQQLAYRDGNMDEPGIASEWETLPKMVKQKKEKEKEETGTRSVAGLDRSKVSSLSQTKPTVWSFSES